MANKSVAFRNSQAQVFAAQANGGSLELLHEDGSTVLVSIPIGADAYTVSNGAATASNLTGTASHGLAPGVGEAASARFKDSSGTTFLTDLTVGISGSDLNLDNTSINDGQVVTITTHTWTESAQTEPAQAA